jgi:DNA-binding transcriptional MerR regulator
MQVSDEENAGGERPDAVTGRSKKMYYSISEVCAVTGIEPHVLRYWEKEFSLLRPKKNSGGKRAYREKDIETIIKIKRMLEEEKYTLQGAKEKLSEERKALRTTGNAAAEKRGKATVAGSDMGAAASIPADTGRELITGESVPCNNSVDNTLILGIRRGLLEVLGLLEA